MVGIVAGTRPTIRFTATSMTIDTGCNTIGGNYTLSGTTLSVTDAGGSTKGCPDDLATQERLLGAVVSDRTTAEQDGNGVILKYGAVTVTAR